MTIKCVRDFYRSSDEEHDIGYSIWYEEDMPPQAIVQLVHGMAEHIDRYDRFARFLVENRYAVAGNNHIGHGNSTNRGDELGHIDGRIGYKDVARDIRHLTDILQKRFHNVPLILFGHSMGSFLSRYYASHWSDAIDGLVLSGTAGKNPLANIGISMINMLAAVKGERYRSRFIDNMAFGSYNKRFEGRTKFDWLSANRENVDAYIEDGRCGQMFTLAAFRNLMTLLKTVTNSGWCQTVRKTLPVLLVSGKDDPVGGYGKGVAEAANQLRSAGIKDVELILYTGLRHEILNETEYETVYGDILRWMDGILQGQAAKK